ncbi:transporter substrate-binding protein [Nonomuraea soli]|uniref:Urea transport system substrate-binding protein n=1 Tax=Nonomuraea soli TaxID=1032476 RepID=A0A7W0CLH3_9ACTN|nr:transporter substrate-binding protein [Nonomuraea soli]MBA2893150.1 urea transport system substrate-binding protein [Nonomuraea soli]
MRAVLAAVLVLASGCAQAEVLRRDPIKVGILHPLSGVLSGPERPAHDGALLAIEELNAAGGLRGREIRPVVLDAASEPVAQAARLLAGERVSVVFGGHASPVRRQLTPLFEKHRGLLVHPAAYEGLESSPNVVHVGATPNQLVQPAIRWLKQHLGRNVYLVGSDDLASRAVNAVARDQLTQLGGRVLGEAYLGADASTLPVLVREIMTSRPQALVCSIAGPVVVSFLHELTRFGQTPRRLPTLWLPPADPAAAPPGAYVARSYFQELPGTANLSFVHRFRRRFGPEAAITDAAQAAYAGVHLWSQAVLRAGSAEPSVVSAALRGQSVRAPEGMVWVDEENLHTWRAARVGQVRADAGVDVVWTSEATLRPVPYPVFRPHRAWTDLVSALTRR